MVTNRDALIYTAEHNVVGNRDAYHVNMAGALPGQPSRINGELISGGSVLSVVFGPQDGYVYFVAPQGQTAAQLYRVPVVDGTPAVPERISAPLSPGQSLSGEFLFAPDGRSVLYTADADQVGVDELYQVDLDRPQQATKVSAPLARGDTIRPAARFSSDGSMIAYQVQGQDTLTLVLADLTDTATGQSILVHDNPQGYRVLPMD